MKQDAFSLKLLLGTVCHRTRKYNRANIGTMSGAVAIMNLTYTGFRENSGVLYSFRLENPFCD